MSALLLLASLFACGRSDEPAPQVLIEPVADAAEVEPATAPEAPLPAPALERYAASHVLVAYQGAVGAPASVSRTREEARARAVALHDQLVRGADFAQFARSSSDGPSAPRGGSLGVYRVGTMVPAFEAQVAAVPVGALTPAFETPFGFHVVRRDAVIEARVAHLLISYAGAHQSASSRTEAEARARAEQALAALNAGQPFAKVAADLSDDVTASHGGELGLIAPGQMIPAFEQAAFALKEGEHSGVVQSPYGFHIVLREPMGKER